MGNWPARHNLSCWLGRKTLAVDWVVKPQHKQTNKNFFMTLVPIWDRYKIILFFVTSWSWNHKNELLCKQESMTTHWQPADPHNHWQTQQVTDKIFKNSLTHSPTHTDSYNSWKMNERKVFCQPQSQFIHQSRHKNNKKYVITCHTCVTF